MALSKRLFADIIAIALLVASCTYIYGGTVMCYASDDPARVNTVTGPDAALKDSDPKSADPKSSDPENTDEQEISRLLSILDKHTEIATKTKMNSDYVPGIVTVLYGSDLEMLGVRDVREALELVPGVALFGSYTGRPLVRGIGEVYFSGKIKTMVNGITWDCALSGDNTPLYLPIEQVDRIEVIRGPGSALYGKNAYLGVVNVITRTAGNMVYGRVGNFSDYLGGALLSHISPEGDLKVSISAFVGSRGHTDVKAGQDALYGTPFQDVSLAPGQVNDGYDRNGVFLKFDYKDIYMEGQLSSSNYGSSFGMADALPPYDDNLKDFTSVANVEAGYTPRLSEDLTAKFRTGLRSYIWNIDEQYLFPPGYYIYENGMVVGPHYKELTSYIAGELHYSGLAAQKILLAVEYENSRTLEHWQDLNTDPVTYEPLDGVYRFSGAQSWLAGNLHRDIESAIVQDQIELGANLTLTIGTRFDMYSNVGSRFSPRSALVWTITENHILKLQYAQAFRPPTFLELFMINNPLASGKDDNTFETIDSYELGYIFRKQEFVGRVTMFYSKLRDLINSVDNVYVNANDLSTKGIELESQWDLTHNLYVDTNVSYTYTNDDQYDREVGGAAIWLANASVVFKPKKHIYVSIHNRYVGPRSRWYDDPRDKVTAYYTLDISMGHTQFLQNDVALRCGIKNIFNTDVRYPSPYSGYYDDYRKPGRQYWVEVSYSF